MQGPEIHKISPVGTENKLKASFEFWMSDGVI